MKRVKIYILIIKNISATIPKTLTIDGTHYFQSNGNLEYF